MKITSLLTLAALGAALGLGFQSCKTAKTPAGTPVESAPQPSKSMSIQQINKILYGQWSVINVNGQGVVGDDRPYVEFDTVATNPFLSKFYAYNGCNVINGMVAVNPSGEMKKAGEYISTMKYCPDAEYEIGVSMTLENVSRFKLESVGEGYLLYMMTPDKQQSMVLRKSDISFANGAWAVTRIGDKVIDRSAGIEMVIDIPEMKVHGNAGCNIFNGSLQINPDIQKSLRFENLATTRMTCPEIALEQEFLEKLNTVATIERDHSDNAAILRNQNGTLVIELTRIALTSSDTAE